MTTLNDIIQETRSHLYANQVPQLNRLAADVGTNDESIDFSYSLGAAGLNRGTLISIDLEHIRVWETDGNTATVVERGVDGTTPAAHTATTSAEIMPKFSPFMIRRSINEDLDDLASASTGIYQVQDLDITYNAAVSGYDMTDVNTHVSVNPEAVIAIQEIRYKIPGPSRHMPAIRSFEVSRGVPVADYPSGMALLLNQGAFPGLPIHVRYRSRFNHLVDLTDDLQTVAGLPTSANGLPALGAAITLMAGREVKRNFTEATSDPLQLELVTGGQVLNSYKGLMALRQERIQRVAAGLLRQWGSPLRVV